MIGLVTLVRRPRALTRELMISLMVVWESELMLECFDLNSDWCINVRWLAPCTVWNAVVNATFLAMACTA